MKGNREKIYPVPAGKSFQNGDETFTLVGPMDEPTFINLGNRWPKANRRPRNRKDSPFTFSGSENYIWAIVDEFGYYVAKVGAVVLDDVIGDAGSFTIGGMPKHPEMYGVDYRGRGFNTLLDEARMPFIKNLSESKGIPIVLDLSNDKENRLSKYQSLGFETLSANDEKHPKIPQKFYDILRTKGRTYAIYIPNSIKEDNAMKKAWDVLKIMQPPSRNNLNLKPPKSRAHQPKIKNMNIQFQQSKEKDESCDYCHRPAVLDCKACNQKLCQKHLDKPCSTGEGDYRYG